MIVDNPNFDFQINFTPIFKNMLKFKQKELFFKVINKIFIIYFN